MQGVLRGLKRCTHGSEKYQSTWERDYMMQLDEDITVKRWERCRTLRMPYIKADGRKANYNPDFVVERVDGAKEIHEVKGTHLVDGRDTERKLQAGEQFCRERSMVFKVITRVG
jgi:hypothetical protein